jgi:hypothetical protein
MQWIRNHLSFANVISVIALFVALGGASYAAVTLPKNSVGAKQIKKNGVGASEIKKNAVRASEIKSSAVSGGDVKDGGLTGSDIGDGSLGGADLGDNSVGGSEVGADALTADDIQGSTLDSEVGPDAFARVATDGTLQPSVAGFPAQVKGIAAENVVKGEAAAATGTYCFDLPFRPAFAGVTLDNADAAAANRNLVTSVAIDRGEDLGDCPADHNDARVRIVDGNTETATDARFFVWFER